MASAKNMDWGALFKNPQNWIFVFLLMLLGVEVFPKLPGAVTSKELGEGQSAILEQLEEYERKEREESLKRSVKEEMMAAVDRSIAENVSPIVDKLIGIERDLRRGGGWTLKDEVELWEQNGREGPDPREIQAQRLADEVREAFKSEG